MMWHIAKALQTSITNKEKNKQTKNKVYDTKKQ